MSLKARNRPHLLPEDASAREVARRADVSLSTVSRVFRESPLVSEAAAKRVREAAREVGYRPNNSARSLRTGVSTTVAYVLRSPTGLLGEFHARAFAAIESKLADRGLQALVLARPAQESLFEFCSALLAQESFCAFLLQADELAPDSVPELGRLPRPVALLNHQDKLPGEFPNLHAAGFDNEGGIVQAIRHLVALGHTDIAFIGGTPATNDARHREEGFRRAHETIGIPLRTEWIRPGHFGMLQGGFLSGSNQMDFLLAERPVRPTAVVAASDEIAVGALASARRCGLSVPDDLSIVGYDNHSWSPFIRPALTTISHDGWEMGNAAATLLIKSLDSDTAGSRCTLLSTELIVRESTARRA